MKDAYSFDVDEKSAEISYEKMFDAYKRIFERCGLNFRAVEADSGNIGGSLSHEFMVLAETGEDSIMTCNKCNFAANIESTPLITEGDASSKDFLKLETVKTPSMVSVAEVSKFLKTNPKNVVKTMILSTSQGLEAVLIRGNNELSIAKYRKYRNLDFVELATADDIKKLNTTKGFSGPIGLKIKIYSDNAIKLMTNFVTGGNEIDTHCINVNFSRDFKIEEFGDYREAQNGDTCASCSEGSLETIRGIEVGHVFKLGTKYSKSMNAKFVDKDGKEKHYFMGCYGIGVGRVVAAAIEQNNDKDGIKMPPSIAPFEVVVIPTDLKNSDVTKISEDLYRFLHDAHCEVVIDDRAENPGVKFKDAELLGIPYQVIIGPKSLANDMIEFKNRFQGTSREINKEDFNTILEMINEKAR